MHIAPDDVATLSNATLKAFAVNAMKCAESGDQHAPFWRAAAIGGGS